MRPEPNPSPGAASIDEGLEEFLQGLARTVQRYRIYPANSPLCEEAVSECHAALRALDETEPFVAGVTRRGLRVGDRPVEAGPLVASELAHRLFRADVAELTIDRDVSPRDLARFCQELATWERAEGADTLSDRLEEQSLDAVRVKLVERREVIDLGYPTEPTTRLVLRERARRERSDATAADGVARYPGDRAWIRLDPVTGLDQIELADLPLLLDEPDRLATLLHRLAEGDTGLDSEEMLDERICEVAELCSALDPQLAGRFFQRLAGAILAMDPERRLRLLRERILPGLLEGEPAGKVLRHFPDVELAESLSLLLELRVAGSEMVDLALDALELGDERRGDVSELLRVADETADALLSPDPSTGHDTIRGLTRDGIALDHREKDFREFAALDLSVDEQVESELDRIRDEVQADDPVAIRLACCLDLLRIEANPDLAGEVVAVVRGELEEQLASRRWGDVAPWVTRLARLAESLGADRPDVALPTAVLLEELCSVEIVKTALSHYASEPERLAAERLLTAFGPAAVNSLIEVLEGEASRADRKRLVEWMQDHATALGPAIAERLDHPSWQVTRNLVKVLGHAGEAGEAPVARMLGHPEHRVVREAFHALAHIGTPAAARSVVRQLRSATDHEPHAEQTLWRFPAAVARPESVALLKDERFCLSRPSIARRLLRRAAELEGVGDLASVLSTMGSLRFRVWRPAQALLGFQAAALSRTLR